MVELKECDQFKAAVVQDSNASALLAAIATRKDRESPFLRLPGEIRNLIYLYICSDDTYVFIKAFNTNRIYRISSRPHGLGIILVCRQIHRETDLLLYQLNEFHCIGLQACEMLHTKFNMAQRAAIRRLSVELTLDEDCMRITRGCEMGVRARGFCLSQIYPNLQRVVMFDRLTDQGRSPSSDRNKQVSREILINWFRDGNEQVEVVFARQTMFGVELEE
ncbi:hypothetical protein BDU57DRAFT_542374 [Ampelomyces quisqualis]|uniref:Uncharacterized protein n=1 Tax=Ampelomyces quisqualis TaxID=50730 RepID=A0A6A5QAY7_AMPQU|nr:hypothetical protein BDU57DRAFT_542374 [Ampelomyces quisqualis]